MIPRDLPRPYIETAITLLNKRGLSNVVEIGSMRHVLRHPMDEIDLHCCLDGHSSMYFAAATDEFTTVDIDFATSINAGSIIKETLGKYPDVVCRDGIEFLAEYDRPIDLLFLDAWDVNVPFSAERHLEAFQAAEKDLHSGSIVLIDDTDVEPADDGYIRENLDGLGGKGRLLIPYMLDRGWKVVFKGRQTLLVQSDFDADAAEAADELRRRRTDVRDQVAAKYPAYTMPEI